MVVVIIVGILAGIGMGHYQRNWKEESSKQLHEKQQHGWKVPIRAIQQSETLSRLMTQTPLEGFII